MTHYSTGCAFSIHDLFFNFPYKKLKLTCKKCWDLIKNNHRDKLVKKIFRESVYIILKDVIENNVTFKLPLSGLVSADIHMNRIVGQDFKNLRKSGKWKEVDLVAANFSANLLGLFLYGYRTPRIKNIYVGGELHDRILELTNLGKQYC